MINDESVSFCACIECGQKGLRHFLHARENHSLRNVREQVKYRSGERHVDAWRSTKINAKNGGQNMFS
jgi:hypothetical protein